MKKEKYIYEDVLLRFFFSIMFIGIGIGCFFSAILELCHVTYLYIKRLVKS